MCLLEVPGVFGGQAHSRLLAPSRPSCAQVRTWVKYYDDQRMPIVANELRQFELRLRNPALHR
ncbi:MAG: hypothetical protein OHK0015_49630 [Chloroflexi bacterium OHK40]